MQVVALRQDCGKMPPAEQHDRIGGRRQHSPADRGMPIRGRGFESRRARHFGTKLRTSKPAIFALAVATSVRSTTLLEPMRRTSRSGLLCGKKKMMPPSTCAQA
jgi:hypothetical protein